MKKTILILGASSFVGSNLLEELSRDYRVIGTYYKNPVVIPGILNLPCDVLKKDALSVIMNRFRPDVVIYAVGMSGLKEASQDPRGAEALNSSGAVNSLMASERIKAKFIYISSAFVFSGEPLEFKEGDTPFSNTAYGSSLSSTEFHIQRSSTNYLILRSCILYGRGYRAQASNWFEELEKAQLGETKFEVDDHAILGFLDVKIFSKILKLLIDENVHNRLINISSSDYMNRFEFAKKWAQVFKKDASFLINVQEKFPFDRTKSSDSSNISFRLDIKNIESLIGTKMPTIHESLESTYKSFKN